MPDTRSTVPSLALVGAGYWGKNLARNFHALGALHTLCDRDAAILGGYGDGYQSVRKTTDYDEVLKDCSVTQVAIAAPATLHHRLARAALEAGKDVFVEKPLCLDPAEAQDLIELAKKRERILMVGHLLQYHPCVIRLLDMVKNGELGRLCYITSNRLNLGKIRAEENALWSFAPHDISVILALAGDALPEQVRCTGEDYLTDGVADTTLTSFRFARGLRAHVFVSWLNPFKEQKLTVVGSQGMAVFDDTRPWAEKLMVYRDYLTWTAGKVPTPSKKAGETVEVLESEPLRDECQHFLDCCQERRQPRTDGQEGLRVLQALQMAQQSLEQDGEAVGRRAEGGGQRTDDGRLRTDDGRRTTDDGFPMAAFSPPPSALRPPSSVVSPPSSGSYFVHPTAVVDDGAVIGKGSKIWHFSHVMKGAQIGERCVLGQNVNVDGGTRIGNNVKIQNNVSVYAGVEIENDVFLGPSCVLTNVTNPRSQINRHSLYEKTLIRRGATVGANATIVCGVTLGRYCFIGAGAVVTRDVPDYALMLGNPARQKGWMSRHGHLLTKPDDQGIFTCPESGLRYRSSESTGKGLECLDLGDEQPLPAELAQGRRSYRSWKNG